MNWKNHYHPPEMSLWFGREDAKTDEYIFQIIQPIDLTTTHTEPGIALLGFCCDEGVKRNFGRTGAKTGPNAIRQQLAKIAIHGNFDLFDCGNIVCDDSNLETAQQALGEVVSQLIQKQKLPIILGGGHETAWGHFQGLKPHFSDIAIINFDAHFDMRDQTQASSGTPFKQIFEINKFIDYTVFGIQPYANTKSIFTLAETHNVTFRLAAEILQGDDPLHLVYEIIDRSSAIYLSVCLDVLAACYAPGVSASQPNGLRPHDIIPAIQALAQSKKVVGFDIVELAPPFDIDNRTAKLAALFIAEFIHHLKSERKIHEYPNRQKALY